VDQDTAKALKLIADAVGLLSTGVHDTIGTTWVIAINDWLQEVDVLIANAEILDAEAAVE